MPKKTKIKVNKVEISYPIIVSNLTSEDILSQLTISPDDKCSQCNYIYPYILHAPDSKEYLQGSHPYCKSQWQDHLTRKIEHLLAYGTYKMNTYSQGISTVVFINAKGEISVPPTHDTPCPAGYTRKDITSLSEAQYFNRELQRQAKENYESYHRSQESQWNEDYSRMGQELRDGAIIPKARYNSDGSIAGYDMIRAPRLGEMSREMCEIALEAERQFTQYSGYDPNKSFDVGIQALYYDDATLRRNYD